MLVKLRELMNSSKSIVLMSHVLIHACVGRTVIRYEFCIINNENGWMI
jgi:hypothetical protein